MWPNLSSEFENKHDVSFIVGSLNKNIHWMNIGRWQNNKTHRFIFCFLLYCRSIHWFHKIFWLRTSSVMPGRICSIYTTLEIIVLLSTKHIRFSCVVLFCHLPMFIQWIFLFKLPPMNDTKYLVKSMYGTTI
jgi:hypothetical protein